MQEANNGPTPFTYTHNIDSLVYRLDSLWWYGKPPIDIHRGVFRISIYEAGGCSKDATSNLVVAAKGIAGGHKVFFGRC